MNHKHLFLVCLLALLFAVGCSKKSVDPTKTDFISRAWQIDEATVTQGAVTVTAYKRGATQNLADLSKFRLNFSSNGTLVGTDQNGVTASGTWAFLNNETQLSLKQGNDPAENATIIRLTTSNFDFSVVETEMGVTSTVTFKMIPL